MQDCQSLQTKCHAVKTVSKCLCISRRDSRSERDTLLLFLMLCLQLIEVLAAITASHSPEPDRDGWMTLKLVSVEKYDYKTQKTIPENLIFVLHCVLPWSISSYMPEKNGPVTLRLTAINRCAWRGLCCSKKVINGTKWLNGWKKNA